MRQPSNDSFEFIEDLEPAFELAGRFGFFHGFIAGEGEFGLAVSEVLEGGDIVGVFDGLMLDSVVLGGDLVALGVGKVHGGDDLLVRDDLVVLAGVEEILPVGGAHADEEFPVDAEVDVADWAGETDWPPPLAYEVRVGPGLPEQFWRSVESSCDGHAFRFNACVLGHLFFPLFAVVEGYGGIALLVNAAAGEASVAFGGLEAFGGVFGKDEGVGGEDVGVYGAAEETQGLGVVVFGVVGRVEKDEVKRVLELREALEERGGTAVFHAIAACDLEGGEVGFEGFEGRWGVFGEEDVGGSA